MTREYLLARLRLMAERDGSIDAQTIVRCVELNCHGVLTMVTTPTAGKKGLGLQWIDTPVMDHESLLEFAKQQARDWLKQNREAAGPMMMFPNRVAAIRHVRFTTGLTLLECKLVVDEVLGE